MPVMKAQRGFTLIELMVGAVIGLLATLVIAQVATTYESRKRTATSGSDAQLNGALALHTLQTDIRSAGYGFTSAGVAGCTQITGKYAGTIYNWTMAPVLITQGSGGSATVSGGPDTVQVLMSSNSTFAVPMKLAENHTRADTSFVLTAKTNVGNAQGDIVLVVPDASAATQASPSPAKQVSPNWCSLANVSSTPTGDSLAHATGASGPWNQDATATVFPGAVTTDIAYAAGSYLINLGTLIDRTYRIPQSGDSDYASYPPNSLVMRTFSTAAPASPTIVPLFSQMVTLQAVYGFDTDADKTVDSWTTTTPTTSAGWAQLIAVRVAVVARSTQYETDEVTTSQPTWKPDGVNTQVLSITGYVPCANGDSSCWKHYRYRVFESIVPLRNMLWQS